MKALPAIIGTAALHLLTALVQAQEADPTSTTKEDPWLASGCSMAQGTALMLCLGDYA